MTLFSFGWGGGGGGHLASYLFSPLPPSLRKRSYVDQVFKKTKVSRTHPLTSYGLGTSFAVASILAMTISGSSFNWGEK